MNVKNKHLRLSYDSILKILSDDETELVKLLDLYNGLIIHCSTQYCTDCNGKNYAKVDEDKCQYIRMMLLKSLKKFNL